MAEKPSSGKLDHDLIKQLARKIDWTPAVEDNGGMGSTMTGWMSCIEVNWEELDKAIDELCAAYAKAKQ